MGALRLRLRLGGGGGERVDEEEGEGEGEGSRWGRMLVRRVDMSWIPWLAPSPRTLGVFFWIRKIGREKGGKGFWLIKG